MTTEFSPLILQIGYTLVFGLLIGVTGGIIYLTLADWRDKRRRSGAEQGKTGAKKKK